MKFFRLIVTAPLHVEVTPPLLSVHLGGNAEFTCEVGTHPQAGPHFITWYKDGRQLPGTGRQSELLRLNGIGREDRGMYQCIVRRSEGDTAQASAELQLGGTYRFSPLLSSKSIFPSSILRVFSFESLKRDYKVYVVFRTLTNL